MDCKKKQKRKICERCIAKIAGDYIGSYYGSRIGFSIGTGIGSGILSLPLGIGCSLVGDYLGVFFRWLHRRRAL